MQISKIFGFLVPVSKETAKTANYHSLGSEIQYSSKLFAKLSALFSSSKKDCDIKISFTPEKGRQDNEVRNHIVKLCDEFTVENCTPLVKSLMHLTNKKIKDGLLFFIYAENEGDKKILIARFPSEEGITVKTENGQYVFEIIDDIFLKNSRYKAVYYQASIDNFWSGYAVDKQINDTYIKEISDYWVKDFLQSELKITSASGSKKLARAIKDTISETKNDGVKTELIATTSLAKNINAQIISFKGFCDKMHLSEKTKNELLTKIGNQSLHDLSFQFDSEMFMQNCQYVIHFLDNGAGLMATTADFPNLWQEKAAKSGKSKYSTEGKIIGSKVRNSI